MSQTRTTEILERNLNDGWESVLVTATGAETKTVKSSSGKVARLLVNGNYNVTINDDTTAKWAVINNTSIDFSNSPIKCGTSIKLTFSGAGSAWIIYK
jgi:hypothetical protein